MRMSDWSSDVCSSDLADGVIERVVEQAAAQLHAIVAVRAELVGQAAFVEGGCRTGLQVFQNDWRLEITGADVVCRLKAQFAVGLGTRCAAVCEIRLVEEEEDLVDQIGSEEGRGR